MSERRLSPRRLEIIRRHLDRGCPYIGDVIAERMVSEIDALTVERMALRYRIEKLLLQSGFSTPAIGWAAHDLIRTHQYNRLIAPCSECCEVAGEDVTALLGEVARLTEALETYGQHAPGCPATPGWARPAPCTCGLDAVRKALP